MRLKNLLIGLLIIVVIFSLINIFVTFIKISDFKRELTGQVLGYVNLTVNTVVSINMTNDVMNWSSGSINKGQLNSTLYTNGSNNGIVLRGNWSGKNAKAFIVRNIGVVNSSLFLKTEKNAHDFFNSLSSSNEEYQWNVSNKEVGSCSGGAELGIWADVNKTGSGTKFCSQFGFQEGWDEVYIDLLITVPYDSGNLGLLSDTITITADAAG